jgi:N-acetylglucosaminyl-diphospho-decaprenol L-rhamnosyltransferase
MTDDGVIFVIVSYNGLALLRSCLRSVVEHGGGTQAGIVVVDNASTDGTPAMVRSEFPGVQLIENLRNLGFGAANNVAVARTSGPLVFFLNPDTELTAGCMAPLVQVMNEQPEVAVVAPLLTNDDGSIQHSIRKFPSVRGQLAELLFLHAALARLGIRVGEVDYVDADYQLLCEVEWVTGAAMLVRREMLIDLGGFDEDFFLYSEEKDLCFRIKSAGGRIVFVPSSRVGHRGAGSGTSPWLFAELTKSRSLFYRKHHSRIGALAYRGVLAAEYALRSFGWYARSILLRDAEGAARERAAGYALGVRSALMPVSRQPNWVMLASEPK